MHRRRTGVSTTTRDSLYHKITDAGRQIAEEIKQDTGEGGVLSGDGMDTFAYLKPLLIQMNEYGGIVTTVSQAISDDSSEKQRPFISCLAHVSLLPMFRMMGTEDNVALYISHNNAVPLTWEYRTEQDLASQVQQFGPGARRTILSQLKEDKYMVLYTSLWSASNPHPAEVQSVLGSNPPNVLGVTLVWTKTKDIKGFVWAIQKHLNNPPSIPSILPDWAK